MINLSKTTRKTILIFAVLFTVIGTLFFGERVLAAFFSIDTNDGSVNEWFNQNVPVFHTDTVSDTIRPDEDIVQAWVATGSGGNPRIYFMMKLAASPALDPPPPSRRAAVASLDCDRDGIDQEAEDLLIGYDTEGDDVFVTDGPQNMGTTLGPDYGERVGEYIEWSATMQYFPLDCRDDVNIRFATSNTDTNPGVPIDWTEPLSGYNIPTTISISSFQANTQENLPGGWVRIFGIIGIVGIVVGMFIIRNVRHKSQQA